MSEDFSDTTHTYSVIFNGDEPDIDYIYKTQQKHIDNNNLDKLVFVAMEGNTDEKLDSSRFLVKNRGASLVNHFMWKQIFDKKKQEYYMMTLIREFERTGKQIVIEDYEFVEDEPFYDYDGQR